MSVDPLLRANKKLFISLMGAVVLFSSFAFAEDSDLSWTQLPQTEMRTLVDRADELLGGTRTDDNKSVSTLRLTTTDVVSRTQASDPRLDFKFTLKLGVLTRWQKESQEWFRNLFHRSHSHQQEKKSASTKEPQQAESAKSMESQSKDPWRFSIGKHLSLKRHPTFWAEARISKDFEGERLLTTFFSSVGWSLQNKWTSQASSTSHTRLSKKSTASFTNTARWLITEKKFSSEHGPGIAYLLSPNQSLNLNFSLNTTVIDQVWIAQSYVVSSGYHLEALKKNLFFSASAFVVYAKAEHFYSDPGVSGALEYVF